MSSTFTIHSASKSENLVTNSILRLYKQISMLNETGRKFSNPKLTQKEIAKEWEFQILLLKYIGLICMDCFYNRKITEREKNS